MQQQITAIPARATRMDDHKIIAVYNTKDTSADATHLLCNLKISSENDPGNKLRESLIDSLSHVSEEDLQLFVFVTPNGWEINPALEHTVRIKYLLWEGDVIKVRFKDKLPRLGIVLSNGKDEHPIGFIHVTSDACKVTNLRQQLQQQHPALYESLSKHGFHFLDNNGWPISSSQEALVSSLRTVTNNVIKLQGTHILRPPQSIVISKDLAPVSDEPVSNEQSKFRPSISPQPSPLPHRHSLPRQTLKPFDIMISYVHKETSRFASLLCDELGRLGFSVFIDVRYIKPGTDWQDVLNEAVYNCALFVPLVSTLYGLTEWTNKEVKLADTLEKNIVPITFISEWPPMCLAIQFATTQYIRWGKNASIEVDPRTIASKVAAEISERYKTMKEFKEQMEREEEQKEKIEEKQTQEITSESTKQAVKASPQKGWGLQKSLSEMIRKTIMKPKGTSLLVVVSYHPAQMEFIEGIQTHLEGRGYEVWASTAGTDPQKRQLFKTKVNEAGAIVFVLSQEFASTQWCEQEVYYCEGRKRIIPVIVDSIDMPGWMSTLIGTETFLDSRTSSFHDNLLEEVECATQPGKAEGRLRKLVEQKTQLHRMCTDLTKNLPSGRLVYIAGGTKIYSPKGKEICSELGKFLAREKDVVIVTGGFFGVGEEVGFSFYNERKRLGWDEGVIHIQAIRDEQDRTLQTRQNSDGTFQTLPYGKTLFYCSCIRQREMLTPKVIDLCVLIEGGPGAAFEAHQFTWSGHTVIPIKVTGGAAGGKFSVPATIFIKPDLVEESDWLMLENEQASPSDIAVSVVNIIKVLNNTCTRMQT